MTFFMLGFLKKTFPIRNLQLWPSIGKGGLYGILATFVAVEAFYFLAALFLASWGSQNPRDTSFVVRFVLSLIAIQGYGMAVVIYSLPFAFSYGAVVGACTFLGRRYFFRRGAVVEEKKNTAARNSLVFGIVGLIFWVAPLVGELFHILAVVFAVKALRQREVESKKMALAGLTLGLLGLLAKTIMFVWFAGLPKGS